MELRDKILLQSFKSAPDSLLKEVSDSELLNDINGNANSTPPPPMPEGLNTEQQLNNNTAGAQNNIPYTGGTTINSQLNLATILSPTLIVKLINIGMPLLLMWIMSWMGKKVKKDKFKATKEEQDILIPLVAAVMQQYNIQFKSPIKALLVGIAGIWGMKGFEVYMEDDEPQPQRPVVVNNNVPNVDSNLGKRPVGRPRKNL